MKILVLKSSGHKKGSSNFLADEFIRGAKESGHTVTEYDVFEADIHPCRACEACGMTGDCVWQDDFDRELKGLIRETDMLVFVLPVYYFNWPAQLKTVVDRFYSFNDELTGMRKKAALISVAWSEKDYVFAVTEAHYKDLCKYMQFEDKGIVLGKGCRDVETTSKSIYVKEAYELGRGLQ